MQVNTFYEAFLLSLTILTLLFQIYGMYIMCTKSPKPMKEYGTLLAMVTAFDFGFTFVLGIVFAPALFFPVPGMYITGIGEDIADILGHEVNKICVSVDLQYII